MKVILAQGTPGAEYARPRHNAGFIVLNAIADVSGASWKSANKFNADTAEITLEGEKVLLVKPSTFYNETGRTARAIADFYKLTPAKDMLVLHDELALPFGAIRVRQRGSDAGNNGIKSLNAHLGPEYWRIRIGVWNELRDRMDDANFVLSAFTKNEHEVLQRLVSDPITPLIRDFIRGDIKHSSYAT